MSETWLARHRAALVSPYDELTPGPRFAGRTLRQVIHLHRGGETLRVHISNRHGLAALDIGEVRLARYSGHGRIEPGSDVAVAVGGSREVLVGRGESVVTDPAHLRIGDGEHLAVSMFVRSGPPATHHGLALQDCYTTTGNTTAAVHTDGAPANGSLYFVAGVDALGVPVDGEPVVVAFGDSLTDGHGTTHGANQRYPDHLSRRLGTPVINAGISGNRLLCDGYGEAGLTRFKRDVLDVPGVTHVIIALGVNDIGLATSFGEPQPTAQQIIAGLTTLAGQARAAGVVPVGATLPPNEGTTYVDFHTAEGETIRQAVNEWIRGTPRYAAVMDIDEALRDPRHPTRYRSEVDSGDHLHPNDSGAAAMASALDPAVFGAFPGPNTA